MNDTTHTLSELIRDTGVTDIDIDDEDFVGFVVVVFVGLLLFLRCCCGGGSSKSSRGRKKSAREHRFKIDDKFTSIEQVQAALEREGLESSNLIVGIDFTKSNE